MTSTRTDANHLVYSLWDGSDDTVDGGDGGGGDDECISNPAGSGC